MTVWHQITVDGTLDALRGFAAAFEGLRGHGIVIGSDLELAGGSLTARIRELLATGAHHRVFAPAGEALELVDALRREGAKAGLRVSAVHEVVSATMTYSACLFSRDMAQRVREDMLASLAEGVIASEVEESTEDDPGERLPGPYDPGHDYEYRLAGRLSGPLPGVLEMHRRARGHEFVEPSPVELELNELSLH